jgi:hypothetical protein
LKDALDRLALVVPHQATLPHDVDHHAMLSREMGMKDTKVEIVESAIQYIMSLQRDMSPEHPGQENHPYEKRVSFIPPSPPPSPLLLSTPVAMNMMPPS